MFLKKILDLKNTLLFRLTVLYAGMFIVLSLVAFVFIYYRLQAFTIDSIDEELLKEIKVFAAIMGAEGIEGAKEELIEATAKDNSNEEFYRIVDVNGDVIAQSDMSFWGPLGKNFLKPDVYTGDADHRFTTLDIPNREFKARMVSAVIGPTTVIQIGETLREKEEYFKILRNMFALLLITLMFFSLIFGWFIARRALRDMQTVTRTAEDIAKGSYDRRVETIGKFREIERLQRTFNQMLDRIQGLLVSLREINDNIAHDLRSPLARIRGLAEMALTHEKSIDDYRNMAVNTMEECDNLIEMINTMFEITAAEGALDQVKIEEFDLNALIRDACELFRPIAAEKRIELRQEIPEILRFRADKKKMQRIVANLVENAIRYTPARGVVNISAAASGGALQLHIEDTGIGISAMDLPRIFDRFYRCDRSRPQGGLGLGLSLVKAYVESMNGTIAVQSTVNQGSTFSLRFNQET
jgi:signal transduction histidine kinase